MKCMETILQLDKLFYHFSHSEFQVESKFKKTRTAEKGKELKRKIMKGDKEEKEKLLLFEFNFKKFVIFCCSGACVHLINRFLFFLLLLLMRKLVFLSPWIYFVKTRINSISILFFKMMIEDDRWRFIVWGFHPDFINSMFIKQGRWEFSTMAHGIRREQVQIIIMFDFLRQLEQNSNQNQGSSPVVANCIEI